MDISALRDVCSGHSATLQLNQRESVPALTSEGFQVLMKFVDVNGNSLDEVGILQIAMTPDPRIDDLLKRTLLFGLLLRRGLQIIHEDGVIVAPAHNLKFPTYPEGTVAFQSRVGRDVRKDAPDITTFCKLKEELDIPVHQIVSFILMKLKECDTEESRIQGFRLKSYSSVMNKLLYRGKSLKDLFAITISDVELEPLKNLLLQLGALHRSEDDVNGVGCLVYRFVRILTITISGKSVNFPVYYEVVKKNYETALVPHEQYQLNRLKFSLFDGHMNQLEDSGFRFSEPVVPPPPTI